MKKTLALIFVVSVLLTACNSGANKSETTSEIENVIPKKARTIITTDGEVDDQDSFIRLLLYLNEFNVEGLIYSSSQWHWKGDGNGTLFTSEMENTARLYGERTDLRWPGTNWMQEMVNKYAQVYGHLIQHDDSYPPPDYLKSIIKVGNIDFEGDMAEASEGSDFIKSILLDDQEGPVYVQLWGGTNTLARALKSIQEEYEGTDEWDKIYKKISDKTFIYTVLDQDATYKNYVAPNWPEIRVIYNSAQFWSFAYMWPMVVPESLKPYMQGPWFAENILFNQGALLETYYTWGDGRQIHGDWDHTQGSMEQVKERRMNQYDFISEGDSPAYFFLLNYGLRSTEDPTFGGLGGRFVQSETNSRRWEDGSDVTDLNPETGKEDSSYPQVRWIKVLQNDFAARANWCVNDYENANHAPVPKLLVKNSLQAKAGETVELSAKATDPDGNMLEYRWWQYPEAGTSKSLVTIEDNSAKNAKVIIPEDAVSGDTIHIILEISDDGTPSLTRFQRVVITVV